MVNKFLDGITVALYDAFGDDYHYYVEDVKQHLATPCFTVDVLNPLSRAFKVNNYQYYRTMPCVIHSFTDNAETTKHELYGIGEKVVEALEYIVIDGRIIRGEDMSFQIVEDDVLEVFITYRFYTETVGDEKTYMEDLAHIEHAGESSDTN